MRLMIYSHDGFGLGNILRMLAICTHLLDSIGELSILVVSGSPMLHSFRLPKRLDYIKLPCLNRGISGKFSAKYLGIAVDETVKLRSELILSAIANFKPDIFLVDKKPYGIRDELKATIEYLKAKLPETPIILLLRDILDHPDITVKEWRKHGYYEAIDKFYERVLVLGTPEIFNICHEYQMPPKVANKVQFCGYIRKELGRKKPNLVLNELQLSPEEKLILVSPGGGEDGYRLIDTYLSSLALLPATYQLRSLIICGPEMPLIEQAALQHKAALYPSVQIGEFTDDLMSYIAAADALVTMGGYNTTCEILSVGKPAVVVPRHKPSQEQWIRAEQLAKRGVLKAIHPDNLTPESLLRSLLEQLDTPQSQISHPAIDLNGLPNISQYIKTLITNKKGVVPSRQSHQSSNKLRDLAILKQV
ncbi:glycosyltransferase [Nostoc sp. CENA67]|uniref:Glycosyltransferase n=1 Tax=Amazonocrinis nigriterrae CENA67 TaxID=2794033 RepID=A0A8J7HZJ5_9NOST|nr:glycosyltransferase [Amazonocrinis nigriterrae]MBH8565424.1 glycosyltransferase [Amazonocrinis nigriterrae CENA67]